MFDPGTALVRLVPARGLVAVGRVVRATVRDGRVLDLLVGSKVHHGWVTTLPKRANVVPLVEQSLYSKGGQGSEDHPVVGIDGEREIPETRV